MSKKDLNEARKWERVNDTQFKRGGSNRFGGGSGKTSTEQQTLSDARNVKRTSGDIGAGVEVVMRKPENYAPTESEKYNPMEQASSGLSQNKMNIERDKQ
jgi:hypothetical protein